MALSKIWAAFILISIVVAGVRYAFMPADKEIFGQMVTGKAGDTVRLVTAVSSVPAATAAPAVPAAGARVSGDSTTRVAVAGPVSSPAYLGPKADGVIEN